MVVFAIVGVVTLPDYGATTDEPWRMLWSRGWWHALETGTVADYVEMPEREYYGVLYDLAGQASWILDRDWLGGDDEFLPRHALNLFAACVALLGVHRLAREVAGERVAWVAMLLLATSPRFYGSAFTNPKDIPFTAAALWSAWASVRLARAPSRGRCVTAAVLAGVCAAVRPFGVAMFFVAAAAVIVDGGRPFRRALVLRALAVIGGCYAVCFVLWPVLWVRPPWHLVTAALELTQHVHGSRSLFLGELYPFWDAPGAYVIVWLGVTLPLVVVVAAPLGIGGVVASALRRRPALPDAFAWALLVAWVVGPAVLPMLRRTTLYDTSRHLLFIVPPLCIFAALAWTRIAARSLALRPVVCGVVGLGVVATSVHCVRLHPYQTLYFNELVGGIEGAQGRFDVAHYSETYREGFEWLRDHHPGARVHVVGNGSAAASYFAWKYGLELNTTAFEFYLSEVRQGWEDTLPGDVVHTIAREGVPLLVVKRVVPMTAPTVAWVWRGPLDGDGPPLPPDRADGWIRGTSTDGRFAVDEVLHGGPGFIAIPLRSDADRRVTLLLCHYLALRVWLDDELVYRGAVVPFQYRGTEDFPSLNPLTVDVDPRTRWLIADLTHARQHWKFGVYAEEGAVAFE
jgi:hypothetical protein